MKAIDWADPPCRICGIERDPHNRSLSDHRFRSEFQCGASCDKPARFWVDGTPLCSTHKDNALRVVREQGLKEPRVERVTTSLR